MRQPPHVSPLTGCCRVCVRVMLLLLLSVRLSAASVCHSPCVCASDIISCPQRNLSSPPAPLPRYTALLDLSFNCIGRLRSDWTAVRLSALHTLLLGNNGLHFLSPEAFVQVRRLRHLDLSSNALTHLDEFVFEPLPHLEVLMLYNNQIGQIDRTAFSGLLGLQKLYLSQNRVSRFPLELLKDRNRLDKLRLLDVSLNRIRALPLAELQALPTWLKDSVYFHGNPLDCSCDLYSVLIGWLQRELRPVSEFPESHLCVQPVGGAQASILQLNCSAVRVRDEEAFLNQILVLDCDSRYRDATKSWTVPPLANRSTVQPLGDGRLQVGPLQAEDSGEYRCVVEGDGVNETVVVLVRVHNSTQGFGESLNTAYTTLACCVLSIVLVVIYLYLTPCPCSHGNHLAKSTLTDSVHSSSLSVTKTLCQQGATHMDFYQPKEQNGDIRSEIQEEDMKEGQRHEKEDRKRRSSISSGTPIMV
ncbi:amphoterin-induced protein 1-like [Colossoma macropomum]|uniref:amphoterin-induced protein 1-like n=1 Tax=Colossoma macropomum TaxID=42526 RepID=UPI00186529B5|nr:amphoterin-induced protein 1-like [Colossoma macropomum]